MDITVQKNTCWERIPLEQYRQKDVVRIITFFVFHSPCPGVSAQGKPLEDYGWLTLRRKHGCLDEQLKQAAKNLSLFFPAKTYENLFDTLKEYDCDKEFPPDSKTEAAFFHIRKNDKCQFLGLFRHIRNAFAHGRVRLGKIGRETAFIFEDVDIIQRKNISDVTAKIVLRKSTLLKWIDIIEAGEKEYNKV